MTEQLNVLELFAGVGGFRVGLEASNSDLFVTKWSNQWEPSRKSQDAFEVYNYQYPNSINLNDNIEEIPDDVLAKMNADIIVGGFPCQDYSVARSISGELGIEGKKGVLFWQIIRAIKLTKPKYLILENVDRLLKSPSKQRGRDFSVMLASLNKLGYSVEWRVINAAEYGRAQRRRRVFFFIYSNETKWARKVDASYEINDNFIDLLGEENGHRYDEYIYNSGLFARQFPIKPHPNKERQSHGIVSEDIAEMSDNFSGIIYNTGIMRHGRYYTIDTTAIEEESIKLSGIIEPENEISKKYYVSGDRLEKFEYLRGAKKIARTSNTGHHYIYAEGGMSSYDSLDLPGRTMLTSEGTVNRSTHLLKIDEEYRLLTPVEAERLQDFPDNWTKFKKNQSGEVVEVSERMRMFFMGNALVTGIVKRIGDELSKIHI